MIEKHLELLKKIQDLTKIIDPEYTFISLAISAILNYEDEPSGFNLKLPLIELAAYYLYPRFGENGIRDADKIQEFIQILTELNQIHLMPISDSNDHSSSMESQLNFLQIEEKIIRGKAYSNQTRRFIEEIQGPFEEWFKSNVGIGPLRILQIIDVYEKAIETNFSLFKTHLQSIIATGQSISSSFIYDSYTLFIPSFEQIKMTISNLTHCEWSLLHELIGLTPTSCKQIQKPYEIKNYPLYFLSSNLFIIITISSAYEAIFEIFEKRAKLDKEFRDSKYIPCRSCFIEEEVYKYVCRIFPPDTIYKKLTYPDPDDPKKLAKSDITIVWGSFLILIEIKGRRFRQMSREGNLKALKQDLNKNIVDGNRQANRTLQYIKSQSKVILKEEKSNRQLEIAKDSSSHVFILNITSDRFSTLTTQLSCLNELELFKNSSYPLSISLVDLDIISAFTAACPDIFLHYIKRRQEVQHSKKKIIADELDLFSCYLETRLHPSKLGDLRNESGREYNNTLYFITDNDLWFNANRIGSEEKPQISLDLPQEVKQLLKQLRFRHDGESKSIAIALLDLSQEAIQEVENTIKNASSEIRLDKRSRLYTCKENNIVSLFLFTAEIASEETVKQRVFFEKYRHHSKTAFILEINVGDDGWSIKSLFWEEYPWKPDTFVENLLPINKPIS